MEPRISKVCVQFRDDDFISQARDVELRRMLKIIYADFAQRTSELKSVEIRPSPTSGGYVLV